MAFYPDENETIVGVGRALRAGRTSCVALLERCFDRIDEREPKVKAWARIDHDGALAQARALDAELAAGKGRGPLHGIPIGIKDIIDVEGLPTAAGFDPWRDRMPEKDAALVARLRGAGAVIVGKTVTTQFAWIDPPPTRNPWDVDRTPGGSSSGSAAAVASGMCLGAIGTQTGGSILRPASFCGVCGLKPTHGSVSHLGIFPFASSFDHPGPIARTPGDLRLLFEAIRDLLPDGPEASPMARSRPPRLSRPRGFYDRLAEPVMVAAFERALAALVSAGAEVVDLSDEALVQELDFEAIVRDHRTLMAVEAAIVHEGLYDARKGSYAPRIADLIEEGLRKPAVRYLPARDDRVRRLEELESSASRARAGDALVMPATIGPAPDPTTTGDPAFNTPWSYVGWPAASFPIGLSPDGLPMALQLVGIGRGTDLSLLETASWCEDVIRRAYRPSARSD